MKGKSAEEPKKKRGISLVVSSIFIICIATSWTLEAELTQMMQEDEDKATYYPKPLAIGYLCRSSYIIWLLPWLGWHLMGYARGDPNHHPRSNIYLKKELQMAKLGCWLVFLYFGIAYTWYLSLAHTTVASNTAIYNSVGVCVPSSRYR